MSKNADLCENLWLHNGGILRRCFVEVRKSYIKEVPEYSNEIHTIHFQPWKYEYAESNDLLFALLREIQQSLKIPETDWYDIANSLANITLGFSHSIFAKVLKNATCGVIDVEDIEKKTEIWTEEKNKILGLYGEWTDQFNSIKDLFNTFIQKGLKKNNKKKLFIFIDDLDRCLPENTIHLLESIKNFLYQNQTLFILAIDHSVVSEMIEKQYQLHQGYGNEYLEKIINYQIVLPKINFSKEFEQILTNHGIKIENQAKNRIISFINEFIRESKRAKQVVSQFAMKKYLCPKFAQNLNKDESVQYAFVAVYLSIKYPRHFVGDTEKIWHKLRFVQGASQVIDSTKSNEIYSNYIEKDNSFTSKELRELIAIMKFQIFNQNGQPQVLLSNIDKLKEGFISID